MPSRIQRFPFMPSIHSVTSSPRPLVLLDRDGTINVDTHYLSRPAEVVLLPGVLEGLRQLQKMGLPLVIITNQSAIGRGFLTESGLEAVHRRLLILLSEGGVTIDMIYYCPHRPEEMCNCRKPHPELALRAAAELNGDLHRSFMVGDKPSDIEFGRTIGARTLLVGSGKSAAHDFGTGPIPDARVGDLPSAAAWILEHMHEFTTG